MRFRPASRAAIAGASLIATWAARGPSAEAQVLLGSTVIPTSSVVTTSSYVPTSYFPTSYVASSYLPTSYVLPTSTIVGTSSTYLPTSYVTSSFYRGGLFRPRRFVERTSYFAAPTSFYAPTSYVTPTSYLTSSYIPTTYLSSSLLPTSYVVPTVATSSFVPTTYLGPTLVAPTSYLVDDGLIATTASTAAPCYDAVAPSPTPTRSVAVPRTTVPTVPGNTITSTPSAGAGASIPNERRPSAATNPGEGASSNVYPDPANPTVPATPKPVETPPPAAPGGPADDLNDLKIPPAGSGARPSTDESINRTSMRPAYRSSRNVLRGKVVSYETGQPEEAVAIVLVNRGGGFTDRRTLTDADGEFKISIPDGDWAVRVTMPSGSVYTVGRNLVASGGRVVDSSNQNVGELRITR